MSDCPDPRLREWLHLYELGLLTEVQQEEFELHLMDCDSCRNEVEQFKSVARHLRHSPQVRDCVDGVVREASPAGAERVAARAGRRSRWRSIVPMSLAAVAVLVLLVVQPWEIEIRPTSEAVAAENRLVILPFENVTDPEDSLYLGQVVSNLLITDLSQSQYVHVVSAQRLGDVARQMGDRGQTDSGGIDLAALAAEKCQARWVLTGAILETGPGIVLTCEVTEATSGRVVAADQVRADADEDLFAAVDRLTISIKRSLNLPVEAGQEPDIPVADVTTHSYDAYRAYLEGLYYYNRADRTEAARCFERALDYDSTFAMAYYFLSRWEFGRPELIAKAVQYSDRVTERERLYIRSVDASISGDTAQYARLLRELLARYPDEKAAMVDLAEYEAGMKNYAEAIRLANRAIDIDPGYKVALNQLVYYLIVADRYPEALEAVERYIAVAPEDANPYDTKTDLLIFMGELDSAIAAAEKVCAIDSGFLDYGCQIKLGALYMFKGAYEKASARFHQAAASGKRLVRSAARTYLALVPQYQGKLKDALKLLDDGIAADRMELATSGREGNRSLKHFLKSLIYLEQGELDRACSEHELAIRVHSEVVAQASPLYRCTYAQVLAERGDFEQAEAIAQVLKDESESGETRIGGAYHYAMGCIELARGNSTAAADHLEQAVEYGDYYDFQFMKARAQLAAGRYDQAITEFKQLAEDITHPWSLVLCVWNAKSHFYLGLAYEKTERPTEAIRHYERFLETWKNADPDLALLQDARDRLLRLKTNP